MAKQPDSPAEAKSFDIDEYFKRQEELEAERTRLIEDLLDRRKTPA